MNKPMISNQYLPRVFLFISIVVIGLTACGGNKWEKMADDVLAAKSSECLGIGDPGPAMIQVCKNIARECERRRAQGIFAC